MKKLFSTILVLGFLFSGNAYANDEHLDDFNQWLYQTSNHQYLNIELSEKCKSFDKGDTNWYSNNCDEFQGTNNIKIETYNNRSEIPEDAKPNEGTLLYYFWMYVRGNWTRNERFSDIKPSENSYQFEFDLREDKYIKKQMQKTALLSYLLYEDGKIVIDEISPKDKFGKAFTNESKYHSQSVGKSFASYILGHAICKGYIDGIDAKINDWPILENTLYYNQKVIDLINMKAGDGKYFSPKDRANRFDVTMSLSRYTVTNRTIPSVMLREFKGSKKSGSKWAYNNLLPHLILNYIIFKIGEDDFKDLLNEIFREKVGIEHNVTLVASEELGVNNKSTTSTFLTTRYDYLRIARAMLEDWQNDTCEGKYLKSLYERKVKKNKDYRDKQEAYSNTKSYGGFFHLDPSGMKNRHIFIMDGYGGQTLTIDFDRKRIVTTMAVHRNFNWKKIAHSVIKKGK